MAKSSRLSAWLLAIVATPGAGRCALLLTTWPIPIRRAGDLVIGVLPWTNIYPNATLRFRCVVRNVGANAKLVCPLVPSIRSGKGVVFGVPTLISRVRLPATVGRRLICMAMLPRQVSRLTGSAVLNNVGGTSAARRRRMLTPAILDRVPPFNRLKI